MEFKKTIHVYTIGKEIASITCNIDDEAFQDFIFLFFLWFE